MVKASEPLGVVAALVRSSYLVNAVYAASAREHGVTSQQGQLLCVLMARPYGMGELGATLGLAKSSLSGLVDRCERAGLVRRSSDPSDTRAVQVSLTSHGESVAEEFYAQTCQKIAELPEVLSLPQQRVLADLLARVVAANDVPVVFLEPDQPSGSTT